MITIKRAGLLSELRLLGFSQEELDEMQAVGVSDSFLEVAIELNRELNAGIALALEQAINDPINRQLAMRSRKDV